MCQSASQPVECAFGKHHSADGMHLHSVLTGHLSHEEAPEALQKFLADFVHRSLAAASGRDPLEYTRG